MKNESNGNASISEINPGGVTILCSSENHPIVPYIQEWIKTRSESINLVYNASELKGGKYLFLISCTQIIKKENRDKFRYSLVIHESDLPNGRGWSPLVWQILENKNTIVVSLIEASDPVDSGKIWKKQLLELEGHEMYYEINKKLAKIKIELIEFVINGGMVVPQQQEGKMTYYKKRTPEDSKLDLNKTILEQFNLIRISDENRYPCFFEYRGFKYKLSISKMEKSQFCNENMKTEDQKHKTPMIKSK